MQRKKEQQPAEKKPIDMTTEELLDHVLNPKVAEKLRELVRESNDRPKPLGSE